MSYPWTVPPFQRTLLLEWSNWHPSTTRLPGGHWEVLLHWHFGAMGGRIPSVEPQKPVLHHGPALRLCVAYHQRTQDQHPSSRESDALAIFPLPLLCSHVWSLQHGAGNRDWYNSSEVYSVSFFVCCIKLSRFWYSCSNMMWGLCLFWLVFACCRGYGGDILQKKIFEWYFPRKEILYIRSNKTYQVQSTISSPGAVGVQLQR